MTRTSQRSGALRALIDPKVAALRKSGMTMAAIQKDAGVPRDTLSNIRKGSLPGPPVLAALAEYLRIPLAEMISASPDIAKITHNPLADYMHSPVDPEPAVTPRERVSVIPLVRQGVAPKMNEISPDLVIATIAAPAALFGRAGAYAVYVADDLNRPWIKAGQVAYVDPTRVPAIGEWVRVFPFGAPAFMGILTDSAADGAVAVRVAVEDKPRELAAGKVGRIERLLSFLVIEA